MEKVYTQTIRIIRFPDCKMVSSGFGAFGEPNFTLFEEWFSKQTVYNYYRLANNATVLNAFLYVMKFSMYKTFAGKYRTSMRKIIRKYCHNGDFTVSYPENHPVGKLSASSTAGHSNICGTDTACRAPF